MNPKTQVEIEAITRELTALLQNPNKAAHHSEGAKRLVARAMRFAYEQVVEDYRLYLPNFLKNPSPLFDSINAKREELKEFLK